jgi:DNA-binding CsgD family transcriptional regulator
MNYQFDSNVLSTNIDALIFERSKLIITVEENHDYSSIFIYNHFFRNELLQYNIHMGYANPLIELLEVTKPSIVIADHCKNFWPDNRDKERHALHFILLYNQQPLAKTFEVNISGYKLMPLCKGGIETFLINHQVSIECEITLTESICRLFVPSANEKGISQEIKLSERQLVDIKCLSKMEIKILKHLAQYKSMKEIADSLYISPNTVNNHLANIRNKLNLKGQRVLLRFALSVREQLMDT